LCQIFDGEASPASARRGVISSRSRVCTLADVTRGVPICRGKERTSANLPYFDAASNVYTQRGEAAAAVAAEAACEQL